MRKLVISMLASALASILGCVDATPSTFPDAGAGGGRPPPPDVDYGDLAPDEIPDPVAVCKACLEAPEDPGPGCGMPYSACYGNTQCASIFDCGFETSCFVLPSQGEIIVCSLPCFFKFGVTSPSDPIVMLTQPLLDCLIAKCSLPCRGIP
jgi:hypothetical protein